MESRSVFFRGSIIINGVFDWVVGHQWLRGRYIGYPEN